MTTQTVFVGINAEVNITASGAFVIHDPHGLTLEVRFTSPEAAEGFAVQARTAVHILEDECQATWRPRIRQRCGVMSCRRLVGHDGPHWGNYALDDMERDEWEAGK